MTTNVISKLNQPGQVNEWKILLLRMKARRIIMISQKIFCEGNVNSIGGSTHLQETL
jgi:hypothetical protein